MYRGCMQLTDRRIYFTWRDAGRRDDIPLFEDAENAEELPPPITPTLDPELALCERGYSFVRSVPLDADSERCACFVVRLE